MMALAKSKTSIRVGFHYCYCDHSNWKPPVEDSEEGQVPFARQFPTSQKVLKTFVLEAAAVNVSTSFHVAKRGIYVSN